MELQFLKFLESIHSPILDKLMVFITSLGNGGIFWIGLGLFFLLQNNKTSKKKALGLFLSLIIFSIVGLLILKPLIGRPRPFMIESFNLLIKPPMGYSFPSGHTGSSFAAAFALYYYNKKEGILALILAALIGFSRMYLSVHYPTDVLAGFVLGGLSSLVATKIINKKYKETTS
ncbi:phosphatase PAP2 family protein [Peptoniphilus sp.]|uniref:phosphatase PAP2 family protein n=1 Tax=Peptoniphilus sp. TaxID=1971214 RepID=UPI003993023C